MTRKAATGKSATTILLSFVSLTLITMPLMAAPPPGKGGSKGGGISSPQAELHLRWRVALSGAYSLVRPVVAEDGTVYAVDVADNLYAVSPDGAILWVAEDAGSKGVDLGPDGTIYTGNENWIKAYYPDGTLKWTFIQTPRAFVFQDVAVGPDGHVYGIGTSGMGVFSLADTPAGPELRWSTPEVYARPFTGYVEIEFGPTADGRDQQLYFHANGLTRAVRLRDGSPVFTIGGGNTNPRVSPFDGTWHRPDSAFLPDAELLWSFEFPLATGTREPTLGMSGTHYAVNSGDTLYAIDALGVEDWQTTLAESVGLADVDPTESMLLLQAGGGTSYPAAILAVSTSNGGTLWRVEFPDDGSGLNQFIGSGAAFNSSGDMAYVMTSFAGGGHAYLNAIDTDPGLPSASTILRSVDIDMSSKSRHNAVTVTGIVNVTDENRSVVSGATVEGVWTLPDGSVAAQTATTSGGGAAKFTIAEGEGIYRLTVTDIRLEGYVFDARHGVLEASWFAF